MLRKLVAPMLWVAVTISISVAQAGSESIRIAQTTPGNCETNASDLNSVAKEELRRDGVVIAIARLGSGETSRTHNRRRLDAIERGLIKSGLSAHRIILAEGEKVRGYGRVELYAAGKPRAVILANPNKAICVECCNPSDADFYPYRRNKR